MAGAALKKPEVWKNVAIASRFLILAETRYNVDELEILRVVWSIEPSPQQFTEFTSHSVTYVLKHNRAKK